MERIGGYGVERRLGEGGMGTVYLARSRGGRLVAVKVARPELAADPAFRERFRAEVAAARRVGGFHTAQVVDADVDGDPPWLATAYVAGPTLAARLAAGGPMDEAGLRTLAAALAEALEAIHGCGLVHRDLKPGNIVMADDGPRVLDFGIARALESTRMTATGTAFGTPGYLAPEQALGHDVTGAADVFALGAVLVASAGGSAWGEGTPMGLMYRSVHEPPNLVAVPEGLRPVVAACLAKDPAERPAPSALLDLLTADGAVAPAGSPAPGWTPTVSAPATPPPAAVPAALAPRTPPPLPAQAPAAPHAPAAGGAPSTPYPPQPVPPLPHGMPPVPAAAPAAPGAAPLLAPEFVVADRRNSVVCDGSGVVFEVEGVEADFLWDELAGITYGPGHRGSHLVVTVRLHDGTSYSCQVHNRRAARIQEWLAQLHAVVSHYLGPRLGPAPAPYGTGPAPWGSPAAGSAGFGSPHFGSGSAAPGGFGPPPR
ncbi:serine/threonine-protein kinase [Streptomyces sp. 2P-4]|uniref:serine/threonine-protein kinase n=1 Tax=Streptomyces sp. 2P-4 TaxID=2931974 RepID=UPI0025424C3E|nr:serine/threonine-protein kinase [Streptomyces sp. 2P-4]